MCVCICMCVYIEKYIMYSVIIISQNYNKNALLQKHSTWDDLSFRETALYWVVISSTILPFT